MDREKLFLITRQAFKLRLCVFFLACLPFFLFSYGCSLNPWHKPPIVQTKVIYFQNSNYANQNHPVAFDLIILYDDELVEKIMEMSAREWFSQKKQFKLDHPNKIFTWEWELVPGMYIPDFFIKETKKAQALVAFADYLSDGEHRAVLNPYQIVMIEFNEREFSVTPVLR